MNVQLNAQEIQIVISALRFLRAQQAVFREVVAAVDPGQVARGCQMVIDVETKLVAAKKDIQN